MDYLLNPMEVTELVCRAVAKREGREDFSFTPDLDTISELFELCTDKYADKFAKEEFIKNKDTAREDQTPSPKLLYYMRLSAEKGAPHRISKKELTRLRNYLGDTRKNPPIEPQKGSIGGLTQIQLDLEKEKPVWFFFYYDKDNAGNPGISRAVLEFGSFGRVRIKDIDNVQTYLGHYRSYGNNDYLLMELKTKNNTKDLHILVYYGYGSPNLIVGQYHNVSEFMYSGTLILQYTSNKFDTIEPKFFDQNADNYLTEIDEPIREYLFDGSKSRMMGTIEVYDIDTLKKYLSKRE